MKYNYKAIQSGKVWIIRRTHYENLCIFDEYFTGYDFMGSANWTDSILHKGVQEMDREEAKAVAEDLRLADDEVVIRDNADKLFLFKARIEGDLVASVETGKRIAEIYDEDQLCGIYGDMEVWDIETMKQVSLLDLVEPFIAQKRWMEQEYRDYCENEAYGDY